MSMTTIARRDVPIILDALWDAAEWQDSIADAHYRSLLPLERSHENTAVAKHAEKQRMRYIKLHDRIHAAHKIPYAKESR